MSFAYKTECYPKRKYQWIQTDKIIFKTAAKEIQESSLIKQEGQKMQLQKLSFSNSS